MKAIIHCEESQAVCIALRQKGIEAYSLDILPCSGGHPEWHIQADAKSVNSNLYDLVISFPPCTALSCSGSRHFKRKRLSGEQEQAINFFLDMWEISNCTENPKNIMSGWKYIRKWFPDIITRMQDINFPNKYTQSIQPHQFGHGETKETWLWLKGVPALIPTNNVPGREQRVWRMGPSPDRGLLRSKTYSGIAQAMADQWGKTEPDTDTGKDNGIKRDV